MPNVVDLDAVKLARLEQELEGPMLAGIARRGVYSAAVADLDDVDRWRRAARNIARRHDLRIRTGVATDGATVWVVDNRPATELERQDAARRIRAAILRGFSPRT